MESLTKVEAQELLRTMDESSVYLSRHAQERMADRDITRVQVLRCLKTGTITEGPAFEHGYNSWKIEVEGYSSGDWLRVSAALTIDDGGNRVTVITAFIIGG